MQTEWIAEWRNQQLRQHGNLVTYTAQCTVRGHSSLINPRIDSREQRNERKKVRSFTPLFENTLFAENVSYLLQSTSLKPPHPQLCW